MTKRKLGRKIVASHSIWLQQVLCSSPATSSNTEQRLACKDKQSMDEDSLGFHKAWARDLVIKPWTLSRKGLDEALGLGQLTWWGSRMRGHFSPTSWMKDKTIEQELMTVVKSDLTGLTRGIAGTLPPPWRVGMASSPSWRTSCARIHTMGKTWPRSGDILARQEPNNSPQLVSVTPSYRWCWLKMSNNQNKWNNLKYWKKIQFSHTSSSVCFFWGGGNCTGWQRYLCVYLILVPILGLFLEFFRLFSFFSQPC